MPTDCKEAIRSLLRDRALDDQGFTVGRLLEKKSWSEWMNSTEQACLSQFITIGRKLTYGCLSYLLLLMQEEFEIIKKKRNGKGKFQIIYVN